DLFSVQEFGEHPNIIKLLDVIQAENDKDIYLIFESMETDLHAVIKKGNLLKDIHKCYILYQLLKATKFIHSGNVIHRDQKVPLGHGLYPSLHLMIAKCYSIYTCEHLYLRSHQACFLANKSIYTKGVDMWSIGCILGEMLLGKPLFPGTSTMDQIEQILRVIPAPSPEDVLALQSEYKASVINHMSSRQRVAFEEIFPSSTPLPALDLLKKLLVFNPDKRLTAEEALQHPYVSRFHCPSREPSLDFDVILPLGDDVQLSVAEYRNKLYEMILEKKSKSLPKEQGRRENIQLSQSESSTLLPAFSSVTVPSRKGQQEPAPPLLNPAHAAATAGVQPTGSSQSKDLARAVCQRPQMSVMVYNPITHTTVQSRYHPPTLGETHLGVFSSDFPALSRVFPSAGNANPGAGIRNCSAPPQQYRVSSNEKLGRQITRPDTRLSPTTVQNLYNVSSLTSSPYNPRNSQCHSKDVRPLLKPSKKMFHITANVEAAGDPRASMGSYSQAYGTISKSALQSLPIAKASKSPE
ncbi:MK15 kinase, partial [Cercotrichas coryphoeus]|nr:MK15 kinase [Cercotrichas coryphoeus]